MFSWLKELNQIRYEKKKQELELKEVEVRLEPELIDEVFCESCETLKQQLSIANAEKKQLLDRLLERPEKEIIQTGDAPTILKPRGTHRWDIQRRELEANDRRVASIINEKKREVEVTKASPEEVAEFEKELDSVTQFRERTGDSKS